MPPTPVVHLIHWKPDEAEDRLARLRRAGFRARYIAIESGADFKNIKARLPDAYVIDLGRLPSHGREMGIYFRQTKKTRDVPLVFVDGPKMKVAQIAKLLPDATYTSWPRIGEAVRRALASQPDQPVVPRGSMPGYAGTPLPKKLGIRPGTTLALVGAPRDFERTLGSLPTGVTVKRRAGPADLTIWFVRRRRDLEHRIGRMTEIVADRHLWIAWPKQSSGVASDLTQADVRRLGLAHDLVDYKIAAIDETWSGLKFARRRGR